MLAELQVRAVVEQQIDSTFQMVKKQRETNMRIVKLLEKHRDEYDTVQILELERAKVKQMNRELEMERNTRKKLEEGLKKLQETLEFERHSTKKLTLFLMAESKQIITKYVEERKRSEGLAQILSEEKQRSDAIAKDLKEERIKSVCMEFELQRQILSAKRRSAADDGNGAAAQSSVVNVAADSMNGPPAKKYIKLESKKYTK